MSFDVVTAGEAMLRLSVPPGRRLATATNLDLHVAGAELNTAVALAQLGRSVTWVSRLPDSDLGRRAERDLRASGVDLGHVSWDPDLRMGIYFVELAQAPRPISVVYDRTDSAGAAMGPADFPPDLFELTRVVHLTGITPALSGTCRRLAIEVAERAREGSCRLTVDINYRAKLWSPEEARETMAQIATGADVVVVTSEDASDVFRLTGEPTDVVTRVRDLLAANTVVLTLGDRGSVWTSSGSSGHLEAIPTEVVDRLGAGDAFMAGVIDGLLDGDLERGLRTGTVLASLALGSHGDHVVTTRAEVDRLLDGGGRVIDR